MIRLLIIITLLATTSCNSNRFVKNRIKHADELAAAANLKKYIVKTSRFNITTYSKVNDKNKPLNIYIEGDGYAWKNRYTISDNPTPTNPVGLKLAAIDNRPNILYIARPCQYTNLETEKNCDSKYWSFSRFSEPVIHSTNEVISKYLRKYKLKGVNLYGYSGGGAVAVIVGARRVDVKSIKTIAGNLNHKELTKIHNVTPMTGSLDAINFLNDVKLIPQTHIAGQNDHIILPKIVENFVKDLNKIGGYAEFKIIEGANHEYDKWPKVWDKVINKN